MKTKHIIIVAVAVMATMASCRTESQKPKVDPVEYVSTLTGTLSSYELSTGNTYPAVAVPWGAHFWTPQTGKDGDGWTYRYDATHIRGIKQTHQPSPWINDYGAWSFMPVTGSKPKFTEDARASWFSHKSEKATPYYYSVFLADYNVTAELAPTSHAAAVRLTYPESEQACLVVDAYKGGHVEFRDSITITGYSVQNHGGVPEDFRNWFIIKTDRPFFTAGGDAQNSVVSFNYCNQVNLKIASSFISLEQAEQNLTELQGDFDATKESAKDLWNQTLGRIEVEDDNQDNLRTFYSCLYRCLLFPRDMSEIDVDGKRVHYSPHTGKTEKGYLFTDTGFWDTFRSLFPLLNLVYPEVSAKVQEGLVNHYKESGFLPEWASPGHRDCMVGNNSASVVADAYLSGIRGYDVETLWEAVTHGAHATHPTVSSSGRLGWPYYDEYGYVPCDVEINESAARTLEYAYDDWCIAQLGIALGKSVEETAPYMKAAQNYHHLYDKQEGLMAGKRRDGLTRVPFSPFKWGGDFTEGNAIHYTWSVFHDVAGLMNLMGGPNAFAAKLDGVFTMPSNKYDDSYYGFPIHEIIEMTIMGMGNYAHGNQPIQHMLYLYDWCGQPWKTQARVREVMEKFYTPNPDGYCGDEDNGQTSAWYVFSAIGFYPVCPGSGQYALGTPLFKKTTLHLPGGLVIIDAPENGKDTPYVESIRIDGLPWLHNYFLQKDLQDGARIHYKMSATPVTTRGTAPEDAPYSMS